MPRASDPYASDQVEGYELASLPTDSLVWTEGLEDWLPMGELPPISALPPVPMKAIEDGRGSPTHGSPRAGRTYRAARENRAQIHSRARKCGSNLDLALRAGMRAAMPTLPRPDLGRP